MKADLIFEGGGVKGISFVGAIRCLEERGYAFQRLAGTSAGAIMAALLAAGYTGRELSMLLDTDFSKFLDKHMVQKLPLLGVPMSLLLEKGLYRGDRMEEWMQGLLTAKGKTKFRDVMYEGKSRLKIIASDITRKEIMILPDDLPKYGLDPMEFEIARAVRMSAAIPLFFKPVVIKYNEVVGTSSTSLKRTDVRKFSTVENFQRMRYKNCESYIVDGGVLSNFPVWIFDVEGTPRWPTFGFRLVDSPAGACTPGKNDLLSYVFAILEAMTDDDQSAFMRDKDSVRTISIPTLGIRSTDFNISPLDSFRLYLSGYESCKKFLEKWDFSKYLGLRAARSACKVRVISL